ncbi:hypothetical protein PO124_08855 [Bacillus licheniformis]|nr:hypothetical protein [Bacillus licheniformis]
MLLFRLWRLSSCFAAEPLSGKTVYVDAGHGVKTAVLSETGCLRKMSTLMWQCWLMKIERRGSRHGRLKNG